jgi:hypothetical protein
VFHLLPFQFHLGYDVYQLVHPVATRAWVDLDRVCFQLEPRPNNGARPITSIIYLGGFLFHQLLFLMCRSSLASRSCQAHLTASAAIPRRCTSSSFLGNQSTTAARRRRTRVSGMHAEGSLLAYINPTKPPPQDLFTLAPSSHQE